MKTTATSILLSGLLAGPALAGGLKPGSVLVYPVHASQSSPATFTILAVTNLNLTPSSPTNGLGGSTNVHYEFVNATPGPSGSIPSDCTVVDRIELLTPADTRASLSACDNPGSNQGYLVVTALDPNTFDQAWSHNHLVGSELIVDTFGGLRTLNAIPFRSPAEDGAATDADADGELDFDGVEYEGVPDELYIDRFVGAAFSPLALINLSGGNAFTASVRFDVFNDNEQALSATTSLRCWRESLLVEISLVFDQSFLAGNTMQDPSELDTDCRPGDTGGEQEVGWARIRGINHSSSVESCPDAALLGALGQSVPARAGARRLWESKERQLDGDFLKTGTDDPECGAAFPQ